MKIRSISLCLAASVLLLPMAANAQRITAPERTISADQLSDAVVKLQRDNANLTLTIRELRQENAQLLGEVEALEYQLGDIRDEADNQAQDDRALARDLEELRDIVVSMQGEMEGLREEVRIANGFAELSRLGPIEPDAFSQDDFTIQPADTIQGGDPDGYVEQSDLQAGALGSGSQEAGYASAVDLAAGPKELFSLGSQRLRAFDLNTAGDAFAAYIDRYEDGEELPEAYYWLGHVQYQRSEHSAAGNTYTDLLQTYPDHELAPSALWKLARSMRLIGEADQACALLAALPQRYPDASVQDKNYANRERAYAECG